MLVSHRKHFIFTKTVKTAGTSVESYFERYCMPEGEWSKTHARDEYVSESGIIGYRGTLPSKSAWYNHMPAKQIRDQIGQKIWDDYFKFTVIRNPFDKLISEFYMQKMRTKNYRTKQKIKAFLKRVIDKGNPIDRISGKSDIEQFRSWIKKGGGILDRDKYVIDGVECVDYFIRFENLHDDMKHVCDILSIEFEPSLFPQFKSGSRKNHNMINDFYDFETEEAVRNRFSWEIERFGYTIPE